MVSGAHCLSPSAAGARCRRHSCGIEVLFGLGGSTPLPPEAGAVPRLSGIGARERSRPHKGKQSERHFPILMSSRYPSTVSSGVASPILCNCSRSVVARRWTASFI